MKKNIKFYVVKDFTNDLVNKTRNRFDLYTCSNGTVIKGATLIIPTFSLYVKEINRNLHYNINNKVYEKMYGVKPTCSITEILNFPVFELPQSSFKVEKFIRDVNWIKHISYKDIEILFIKSLNTFLMDEFGDSLLIDDGDINVIVRYIKDMEAVNIEINVDINKEDLVKLTSKSLCKFSPLLRGCVSDDYSLINFVE